MEVMASVKLRMESILLQGRPELPTENGGLLYIHPGAIVELFGCNLLDGFASLNGGAIYIDRASLVLRNGGLRGHASKNGGSIYNNFGNVSINSAAMNGKSDGDGGAIYNNFGILEFSGVKYSTLLRCVAMGSGGGIFSRGGHNFFSNMNWNLCSAISGGALYLAGGARATIRGCTFRENTAAANGGGFVVEDAEVLVVNSVFSKNTASGGAGASILSGSATFLNCTFAENVAATAGGGLHVGVGAHCRVGNSVFALGSAPVGPDILGEFTSLGHNFFSMGGGDWGYAPSDLVGSPAQPLDPMMKYSRSSSSGGPPHFYIPQPGSPLIDAGDTKLIAEAACTDLRQSCCPRVRGAAVDIGAIEVQEGESPLVCAVSDARHSADMDGDGRLSLGELLRAIQLYNAGSYHCDASEDGYAPGPEPSAQDCPPHSADRSPQDWQLSLTEILRLIQLYNAPNGFTPCENDEDGFCPA